MKKVNLTAELLKRELAKIMKRMRQVSNQLMQIEELGRSVKSNSEDITVPIELDDVYNGNPERIYTKRRYIKPRLVTIRNKWSK